MILWKHLLQLVQLRIFKIGKTQLILICDNSSYNFLCRRTDDIIFFSCTFLYIILTERIGKPGTGLK